MQRTVSTSFTRISIAVVLALLIGLPSVVAREWGDLSGVWDGIIKVSGTDLGIEVTFIPGEKIEWTGNIDIAVQGAKNIPLGNIMLDGNQLTFTMIRAHGDPVFEGELSEDGMSASGTFTQGGSVFPFTMTARDDSLLAVERTTLLDRLTMIREFIDTARVAWDVPGLSIAILSDGFVVLSVGSGSRNLAEDLPAARTTLYLIGSATQVFTATGLADLVVEGRLSWDEPLRSYLPEFDLADQTASRYMTSRDLLSHRSGLPPHQALNRIFPYTRAELAGKLKYLEPSAEFRTNVQPQELMYTLAGYLTGQIKNMTWEEVIRRNLLGPLRMGRTGFSADSMLASYDYALPYRPGPDGPQPTEVRRVETLSPASGMYSSAVDLSRWLEFWLRRGTTGQAARVMSSHVLDEMITPQAVYRPSAQNPERLHQAAALGWSVEVYRGHRRAFSDGFVDGYSNTLSFLPDDGLGVVVLCNADQSPLPEIVSLYVTDLFLDLEPVDFQGRFLRAAAADTGILNDRDSKNYTRRNDTKPGHKAVEYAGIYEHGIYGQIAITAEGKKLTANLNDQVSELRHWHYDTFRANFPDLDASTDLTFRTDDGGDVISIAVPFEPQVDPIEFLRQPLAEFLNPRFLEKFVGGYELRGQVVRIEMRRDNLFYIQPGQRERRLIPGVTTRFNLKGLPGTSVEFILDDQRVVERILLKEPEGVFAAPRLPEVMPN